MKMFFIYYSRSNDPLLAVYKIHNRAAARARRIGKPVAVIEVDINTVTGATVNCYSGTGTIECVTADSAGCKDRARNPTPKRIDAMIDNV